MRRYNECTSLEPHFYEEVQEVIDEIAESKGEMKSNGRLRLQGMLTALYALTNELWESEIAELGDSDFSYIHNVTSDEMVIPSALGFVIPMDINKEESCDEEQGSGTDSQST